MESALHIQTKVLPGNKIEIQSQDLAVGDEVDVFIVTSKTQSKNSSSVIDLIEKMRNNISSFKTPEEIEKQLQEERKSWEI